MRDLDAPLSLRSKAVQNFQLLLWEKCICVPNRNIYCTLFNVDLKRHKCRSARCASADNAIRRNVGIL